MNRPKLEYSLLAAGFHLGTNPSHIYAKTTAEVHPPYVLLSLLSLFQLLGIVKNRSARFTNKVSNWTFTQFTYIAMNASKLVDDTLPPFNGTSVARLQGSPH